MLRIPDLKPGEQPFDPDFTYQINGGLDVVNHQIRMDSKEGFDAATEEVMLMDGKHSTGPLQKKRVGSPDYVETIRARTILDHVLVKDAVTTLHQEDDAQMETLEKYSGIQIADIVKDQERFLKHQEEKYGAMFTEARQKQMFQEMSRSYFLGALDRSRRLRNRKVREFQLMVIERQNMEFADRALRDENVFNDMMQTVYRDMILFNLENIYAELPEKERRERMDKASAAFYEKILDKRLELSPEKLQTMLDASAVKRVLDKDVVDEYTSKAKSAVRESELTEMAKSWAEEEIAPKEAKGRIAAASDDANEQERLQELYSNWRYNANKRLCLTRILNAGTWVFT